MTEAVKISTKFALAFLKNKTETINILRRTALLNVKM
jgi:hypothetical protein